MPQEQHEVLVKRDIHVGSLLTLFWLIDLLHAILVHSVRGQTSKKIAARDPK